MLFWLVYTGIFGIKFLTPSFVIYVSKHHHHHKSQGEDRTRGVDDVGIDGDNFKMKFGCSKSENIEDDDSDGILSEGEDEIHHSNEISSEKDSRDKSKGLNGVMDTGIIDRNDVAIDNEVDSLPFYRPHHIAF
jgi:hypothetical protein